MKSKTFLSVILICTFVVSLSGGLFGSDASNGMDLVQVPDNGGMNQVAVVDGSAVSSWRWNVSLLALSDVNGQAAAPSKGWNWHKTLGFGTIITALGTVASGFTGPEGAHCGLAALSTGLAAATCVNGFWTYGNIFTAGDTRLTIHAVSGMLSTVGFGLAAAHADESPHGHIGIASGTLFLLTVGVVYF